MTWINYLAVALPCLFTLATIWLVLWTAERRIRRHAIAAANARAGAIASELGALQARSEARALMGMATAQLKELSDRESLGGPLTEREPRLDPCDTEPASGVVLAFPRRT